MLDDAIDGCSHGAVCGGESRKRQSRQHLIEQRRVSTLARGFQRVEKFLVVPNIGQVDV